MKLEGSLGVLNKAQLEKKRNALITEIDFVTSMFTGSGVQPRKEYLEDRIKHLKTQLDEVSDQLEE